ncbi:MAG TPA: hypothetical protein VMZ30_09420 [Pyrinomonadaceae bacterium]|nr:hypothetical protein [Pyrinomonadaceae bacterium]
MKAKLIAVVLASLGLIAVGVVKTSSKVQRSADFAPSHDRLRWYAQKAKGERQTKVSISSMVYDYAGSANSLDVNSAFATYTVVIGVPLEKRTYQFTDNDLVTWYKFRIVDTLSDRKNPPCTVCDKSNPPQELLPLASDEFVLPKNGGQILLDGVEVEQVEKGFPQYELGQKYLFLLFLEASGVATTAGGPLGVFTINADGTFLPINTRDHPLKKGLKQQFSNSVERLRNSNRSR